MFRAELAPIACGGAIAAPLPEAALAALRCDMCWVLLGLTLTTRLALTGRPSHPTTGSTFSRSPRCRSATSTTASSAGC
ncbi:hypothetical protein WMF11_07625 [Sorangium sp. So ce295]|uniref:hypothetical protein n=1 Tax=Sorangium sp. So ce295 TaxID=3133295 RepID=UPI003F63FCF0